MYRSENVLLKCILGLAFLVCFASPANAQFDSLGIGSTPVINASPEFPEPGQAVTANLEAYTYDLRGASIAWFIDGIENTDFDNLRSISITAPATGASLNLSSVVTLASGQSFRLEKTIKSARVDIVVEAESTVPLFYRGRALPVSGSPIRAIAIVDSDTNSNTLTYTWRLNNKMLYGGSSRGRDVAEFSLPYGGAGLISVEVADANGATIARKLLRITTVDPMTIFYEDNPLRGLARQALSPNHQLLGDEMTVRAEPYYMSSDIFTTNQLIEWKIDNQTIDNPSDDPQNLTLRNDGGTGRYKIEFHIRNLDNLLQGTREDFTVSF